MANINWIKVMLVEKDRTNKLRAELLGKALATISTLSNISAQLSSVTWIEVAKEVEADARELIVSADK